VRTDVEYAIINLRDGTATFATSLPGEEQWVAREENESGLMTHGGLPVIFGRRAVAAVTDDRAYLATTDSLILTGYDEMGSRELISLGQEPRVTVPDQWIQIVRDTLRSYIEAMPERSGDGQFIRTIMGFDLRLLAGLPSRSTLPSFSDIRNAAKGRLWIRGYSSPTQDYDTWVRLSEEWVPQQWVEIPKALIVLDFSEDQVLVRRRGEFGEDIIEVYPIER
jgi:hypothetical protein